jgi:hypothetical protein
MADQDHFKLYWEQGLLVFTMVIAPVMCVQWEFVLLVR